jgi:hypothetical protein
MPIWRQGWYQGNRGGLSMEVAASYQGRRKAPTPRNPSPDPYEIPRVPVPWSPPPSQGGNGTYP